MKRLTLFFFLLASFTALLAQPRAIGLRLGPCLEFSYEHGLKDDKMLSIEAGLCFINGAEVAITHDWINPGGNDFSSVWHSRGTWNWYAGVGGAAGGYWDHRDYYSGGFIGAAGRLGVEYNFWFPLQLSVDFRPVVGIGFDKHDAVFYSAGLYAGALAIGVRYHF